MANPQLQTFIREARKRGFTDHKIENALRGEGWTEDEVEHAFESIKDKQAKNHITIYLDNQVLAAIEKRANRNMLSPAEQIEDIVRRSAVNAKGSSPKPEKLDDLLVAIFSRKTKKR